AAMGIIPVASYWYAADRYGLPVSLRAAAFSYPEDHRVRPRETLSFATIDGVALHADIYRVDRPRATKDPAIVVLHGGGWSTGGNSALSHLDEFLAKHHFTVFDVEYRLKPSPNDRSALGDVKCAVGWLKTHAPEFGVDPNNVSLLGHSAGAHLALLAA